MKAFAVRFGPPLAYQFAWFCLILAPTFALAAWIVRYDDSLPRFFLAVCVVAVVVCGAALLVYIRFHDVLKVNAEFDHLMLVSMMFGGMPVILGAMGLSGSGRAPVAGMFIVLCLMWLVIVWSWWALGWASPGMPPPLGFTMTRQLIVRLRSAPAGVDSATVAAKVIARRELGTQDVIRILLGLHLLPSLPSGERRWAISIGGDQVGTLTQTPESPDRWPAPTWQVKQRQWFDRGLVEFIPDRHSADASDSDQGSRPR